MTTHERAPLDAEERALAALLARHAPEGGPSPELDARILAQAREGDGMRAASTAAGVPPAAARPSRARRRRRWPAMLGAAASLALAVGVAWQLRPLPAPEATVVPQSEPAPVAALRVPTQPDTAARTRAAPATSPALPAAPGPGADADAGSDSAPPTATQADEAPAAAASESDAPPERDVAPPTLMSAPTPAPDPIPAPPVPAAEPEPAASPQTVRPAPAPAAALPPPPRPMDAPVPRDADGAAARSSAFPAAAARGANATAIGRRAVTAPAPAPAAAMRRSVASTAPVLLPDTPVTLDDEVADDDAPELDEAFDEAPPATADSPEVHRAWLKRIRELRDAGRTDEARESLDELRRRFPELRVPDDLQSLGRPQPR